MNGNRISRPRRALSWLLKGLGGLLLLLLLCLGGLVVWLQTPGAATFLAETAQNVLRGQGLSLELEEVSGPLPQRLLLRGIRLADDQGLLFTAELLEIRLRPAALLRRTVDIELAALEAPKLLRLPQFAPGEETETGGGLPVLPVDILLRELRLDRGELRTAALSGAAGQEAQSAGQAAPANAQTASINLRANALLSGQALSARAKASVRGQVPDQGQELNQGQGQNQNLKTRDASQEPEARALSQTQATDQGLILDVELTSSLAPLFSANGAGVSGSDSLRLELKAVEDPGGLAAALLGLPNLPGYDLALNGSGPVRDWQAVLTFSARQAAEKNQLQTNGQELVRSNTRLSLRCGTGVLWQDLALEPNFTFELQSDTSPGKALPAALLPLAQDGLTLRATASAEDGLFRAEAEAGSRLVRLNLTQAALGPEERLPVAGPGLPPLPEKDGSPGNAARARLRAEAPDIPALQQALAALSAASDTASADAARHNQGRAGKAQAGSEAATAQSAGTELGADKAALDLDLALRLGADGAAVKAAGTLALTAGAEDFSLPYSLGLRQRPDRLVLESFLIQGLGLNLQAEADMHTATGAVKAGLRLKADDNAPWQDLALRLAGFAGDAPAGQEPPLERDSQQPITDPAGQKQNTGQHRHQAAGPDGQKADSGRARLGGRLQLDADLDFAGFARQEKSAATGGTASQNAAQATAQAKNSGQSMAESVANPLVVGASQVQVYANTENTAAAPVGIKAGLRLAGHDLRWPTPQLEAMLGTALAVEAQASGSGNGPYLLRLNKAEAGIFSAHGWAALSPKADGARPEDFFHGSLQAEFEARVADLAPLSGAGDGLSGPLAATLTAKGQPIAPELALSLDSPELTLPGQTLRELHLAGRAHIDMAKGLAATGDLSGQARANPGGPVTVSANWRLDAPQSPDGHNPAPLSAAIESLRVTGAGVTASADLTALLPAEAQPLLNGRVKADIADWSAVSALANAPLSGAPAGLELSFENRDGKQAARASLALPSLRLGQTGGKQTGQQQAPLRLRDVSLSASLTDLFGAPDIDAVFSSGPGRAGFLRWRTGRGSIKGSTGKGDFDLALTQNAQSGFARAGGQALGGQNRSVRGSGGRNSAGRNNFGGLALRGAYSFTPTEALVRLDEAALREPRSKTGLRLVRPLTVALDQGVSVKDLDAAFEPGGALTAEAAFTDDSLRLKAQLVDLPFTFFALFGLSGLPDGFLAATADFSGSPAAPRGAFSLDSRMSATQPATGLERAGQSAGGAQGDKANAGGTGAFAGQQPATATGLAGQGATVQQPAGASSRASGQNSALPPVFALRITGGLGAGPGGMALRGQGHFGSAAKNDQTKEGRLDFSLPLTAGQGGLPLPNAAAPLRASVYWKGPVESLWQAVPLPDRYLSGPLLLDARVAGSLNKPDLGVSAYMAGGRYEDIANGILVSGIDVEARNAPGGDVRVLLAAKDNSSGALKAEADLKGFQDGSPVLAFRCQLDGFKPLHRDDLDVTLSGYFGVNGPLDSVAVKGLVHVDHGELVVSTQLGGSVPLLEVSHSRSAEDRAQLQGRAAEAQPAVRQRAVTKVGAQADVAPIKAEGPVRQTAPVTPVGHQDQREAVAGVESRDEDELPDNLGPALDMRLVVPRRFYIRGMGLDSEWQGDLRITGTAAEPSLLGSLAPVRGYLEFLARTFEFTGGNIFFDGGREINPGLNLELTYENPDITAIIRAGGSAKRPKISMDSRPPLPQDEVLAHVLFGKNVSDLSRFEAIQLADSMRQLTGYGGSGAGLLTGVRQQFGLDMLRLGGNQDSQQRATSGQSGEGDLGAPGEESQDAAVPALEAGKYINDSIYVGVEQGVGQDSTAVRVEVELFPRVTLEGKSSSEASEVGIGWKMDY